MIGKSGYLWDHQELGSPLRVEAAAVTSQETHGVLSPLTCTLNGEEAPGAILLA